MGPYDRRLDPSCREVRRLQLLPAALGPPLSCTTEVVSLESGPQYEALSYVWGDPATVKQISLDNLPILVTENLFTALLHLRQADEPRHLWIDALCVNQKDVEERNEQVKLMGEIYANANRVLIWIGESSKAWDGCFRLVEAYRGESEMSKDVERQLFGFYIELVRRDWFHRLWTVQELVLGRDPVVCCGQTRIPWDVLVLVWQKVALPQFLEMGMAIIPDKVGESINRTSASQYGIRPSGIKIDLLNNLRRRSKQEAGDELLNLFLNTASANCSEPRDRVYSLLGMMYAVDRAEFRVDYSKPTGSVYAEAIAYLFRKGKGQHALAGMALAGPQPPSSDTPSWTVTFGSKSLLGPTRLHPPGVGVSGPGADAINGSVDPDLKTLRIRGLFIDVVEQTLRFGGPQNVFGHLSAVERLVEKSRQAAGANVSNRPYLHKYKDKEPVWRTLIANKAYSGAVREAAPESYGDMYKLILKEEGKPIEYGNDPARDYRLSLLNVVPDGSFFLTKSGFRGICQAQIEQGDHLVIWLGAPVPFILRPQAQTEQAETVYAVVGVAYVAGIMDGEMVDEVYCEDLEDDMTFVVR